MAGMSIPSGFNLGSGFSGASTAGFTGGQQNPNTTAAVTGYDGKLEAYDPARMASTATAIQPVQQPDPHAIAGFTNGLPDWQVNWLQNGGQGELKAPEASTGANQSGPGSAASTFVPPTPMAPIPPPAAKKVTTTKAGATSSTAGATSSTAGKSAPALTMVPQGNSFQQPLAVNDQWNFQAGTSMPVATAPLGSGGPNSGGGQMPIYQDGKGGFFYDAAGTKPVPAGAAQQFKSQLQLYGHL